MHVYSYVFSFLRSKEVCGNLPSNFDISDIPMVVIISIPLLAGPFLTINNCTSFKY